MSKSECGRCGANCTKGADRCSKCKRMEGYYRDNDRRGFDSPRELYSNEVPGHDERLARLIERFEKGLPLFDGS